MPFGANISKFTLVDPLAVPLTVRSSPIATPSVDNSAVNPPLTINIAIVPSSVSVVLTGPAAVSLSIYAFNLTEPGTLNSSMSVVSTSLLNSPFSSITMSFSLDGTLFSTAISTVLPVFAVPFIVIFAPIAAVVGMSKVTALSVTDISTVASFSRVVYAEVP